MAAFGMELEKGEKLKGGVYGWHVWLIGHGNHTIYVGWVKARTQAVAAKKAKALICKHAAKTGLKRGKKKVKKKRK